MSIYHFKSITKNHSSLGGKGYNLGLLKNAGFPVPDGLILDSLPEDSATWETLISWWKDLGSPKLAIRSSAIGEDSSEQSFAGQNSTYLNVCTSEDIKVAIANCFLSITKSSSTLYREHFLKDSKKAQMNVVIQKMVDPLYSGVFFSSDPRTAEAGWIVESIEGLGEDLVSGKKTPLHFEEKLPPIQQPPFNINDVIKNGREISTFLEAEIDMEWAIDKDHVFYVLQARPITALSGKSEEKRYIDQELKKLKALYPLDTIWDGSTFAEWSAPPTELTFSLWRKAFARHNAFSDALKKLGYLGIDEELKNPDHSLLERIFAKGHVNISMLAPLYFGPIPYHLEMKKSPRLKFDFKKMTFKTFILTPFTMWKMLKVGLELSTKRGHWLSECTRELSNEQNQVNHLFTQLELQEKTEQELIALFQKETQNFYRAELTWSLVLITLIESTRKNIVAMLKGVLPQKEIYQRINTWLSLGLNTVTMEMNQSYRQVSNSGKKEKEIFLSKYGHRGPGELELSHPRWIELKEKAFLSQLNIQPLQSKKEQKSVEEDISSLKTYKKDVILKEWLLLKEMLELREKWKMQILYPYANIRFLALEIAARFDLGNEIFWFNDDEIINQDFNLEIAKKRKSNAALAQNISLPNILELKKLEDILTNKNSSNNQDSLSGLALSPGLSYGEVRVVTNPEKTLSEMDSLQWPENTILVAESTDPGWTGLFLKSKAIVVSKGGVLSHCAIVAREMGLPAISEIKQCHLRFKDGDKIWVDGNNGRITLDHQ